MTELMPVDPPFIIGLPSTVQIKDNGKSPLVTAHVNVKRSPNFNPLGSVCWNGVILGATEWGGGDIFI